eukprot:TRINITY_DN8505_c0_g1_i1.p3 TRINITY_DN8505_c0_g1~~TRINITY_DN8505_c0_g1_i1.p3  ORF type:complete len:415 (+),score=66.75 TRINITY_DN8505_c0_g1_i1:3415-4659(+)
MNNTTIKGILLLNISLYAFCYMMQQPVLPEMVKQFVVGDDAAIAWAKVQTVFAGVQLIGGLIAGVLSDKLGALKVLYLSAISSVLSYAALASTSSMETLYLAQLPGVFQHTFMATSAYMAVVTTPAERSQMLGNMQIAYAAGMITGPICGGYIGQYNGAVAAAVVSLLSTLLLLFLPSVKAEVKTAETADESKKQSRMQQLRILLTHDEFITLCIVKVFAATAMGVWRATASLVLSETFGFGPIEQAYFMSFGSVVGVVVVGLQLIKFLENKLPGTAEVNSLVGVIAAVGFIALPMSSVDFTFWVALVPVIASMSILRSTITSAFTKHDPSLSGTLISIDMAIGTGVSLYAPTLGTYVFKSFGFPGLTALCALSMVLMAAVSSRIASSSTFMLVTVVVLVGFSAYANDLLNTVY